MTAPISPDYITAADLSHSIEIAKCVKLYAFGSGNHDRVYIFPYRGKLSPAKVGIMAEHLQPFYPHTELATRERAIRNLAERCAWTSIKPYSGRYGNPMVEFRGDGWMNIRAAEAVIIFNMYTDED